MPGPRYQHFSINEGQVIFYDLPFSYFSFL
jgi:hypothetical protein